MLTKNDVTFLQMILWEVIEKNRKKSDEGSNQHGDFCNESKKAFEIRTKLGKMYPALPNNDNEMHLDALLHDLKEGKVSAEQVKTTLLHLKVLKLD